MPHPMNRKVVFALLTLLALAPPAADVGNPAAVLGLPGGESPKPQEAQPADQKPAGVKPPDGSL